MGVGEHRAVNALAERREKLERMGDRLARIAHEINKPASLVAGSLDNLEQHVGVLVEGLRDRVGQEPETADRRLTYALENTPGLLAICRDGVERLTHVSNQLKALTRGREPRSKVEAVDLKHVLENSISWARCERNHPPAVICDLPLPLTVAGDTESLAAALVNLIGNAFDAVAETPDPCVWVTARVDDGSPWVEVRIRDNGPGVRAADRDRIFTPFFTTKGASEGLGLGLAIARESIESQGGTLELAEPADGRAEFVLRLPLSEGIVAAER